MKNSVLGFLCLGLLTGGCAPGTPPSSSPSTPVASPTTATAASIQVPPTAEEAILAVNELSGRGDLDGAVALTEESLKKYPDNFSLLVNRGSIYIHQKKYELAERDFAGALASAPKESRWMILSQRARCAMELGQAAKAERDFADSVKALAADPQPNATFVEQLWRLRGNNLLDDLKYRESIPCFTEALRLDPKSTQSLMMRALAYSKVGDQKKYQKDLSDLKTLNPEAAAALRQETAKVEPSSSDEKAVELAKAGTLKLRDKDFKAAIKLLDQAIKLDPKMAQAYTKRGSAYQSLEDHRQAIADYTASYDLDHNEIALFNRAICYLNTGEFQKAESDLQVFVKSSKSPDEIETAKRLLAKIKG